MSCQELQRVGNSIVVPYTDTYASGLQVVECLLSKGFLQRDIDVLKAAGYVTLDSIAQVASKTLLEVKGLSEQKVAKIKEIVKELCPPDICTAAEYLECRLNLIKFTTGSTALDALLQGGIESGSITEIIGDFSTGKTQLCHTLAITSQLPIEQNGGEGKCLWIDTQNSFRPERLGPIANRFGLSHAECVANIVYVKVSNTEQQFDMLVEAAHYMAQSRFAMLIVDSATALYRTDYTGRGELAARQMSLGKYFRALKRLADIYGVAVVVTNQVMARVDNMSSFMGGNDKVPVGGHVVAQNTQTRLFLRKARGNSRVCKVYNSPSLPEGEAVFAIAEGGIVDYDDSSV